MRRSFVVLLAATAASVGVTAAPTAAFAKATSSCNRASFQRVLEQGDTSSRLYFIGSENGCPGFPPPGTLTPEHGNGNNH